MLIVGTWKFPDSTNSSSKFPDFRKSTGNSVIELVSTPTKINGVHYVQVSALDGFDEQLRQRKLNLSSSEFVINDKTKRLLYHMFVIRGIPFKLRTTAACVNETLCQSVDRSRTVVYSDILFSAL